MNENVLEINDFHYYYGGIHAVQGITLHIKRCEMVSLIGVNGSGKTTLLSSIGGVLAGKTGSIVFDDIDITKKSAHAIAKLGIGYVMEGRHIFPQLTVLENLKMGAYLRRDKKEIQEDIQKMYAMFPRLEERKAQLGGTLSGGEQQMLAIARILMGRPKLLLLDEPSLGIAPIVVQEIFQVIRGFRELGIAILLVEQNSNLALETTDRVYIMEAGRIVIEGNSKDLMNDEAVRKAYLGEGNI